MVTKGEFENEILGFISEYWSLCNPCGECCKKLAIPMHSLELPLIARLFDDDETLRLHIQRNPYPFNVQSEYYFKVDSGCPFLDSTLCSIYINRPLGCRLFPVRLMAFLDNGETRFQEPLFKIESGESHLPCMKENILMNERLISRASELGKPGEKLIDYLVAAIVDDTSFVYIFGQEPARSIPRFNPNLKKTQSMAELSYEFLDALYGLYQDPTIYSVEAWQRLVPLSDAEIDNIRSREFLIKVSQLSSRLLKRMMKHKHPMLEWRKYVR